MLRETVIGLRGEVQRWCVALGISQNEYARRCGIHPSILSRVLRGTVTSEPAEKKIRAFNARLHRRLEKAS
jgi:transcriptional regulator with XRE-family HTH domain